jgi:hypothetical protein
MRSCPLRQDPCSRNAQAQSLQAVTPKELRALAPGQEQRLDGPTLRATTATASCRRLFLRATSIQPDFLPSTGGTYPHCQGTTMIRRHAAMPGRTFASDLAPGRAVPTSGAPSRLGQNLRRGPPPMTFPEHHLLRPIAVRLTASRHANRCSECSGHGRFVERWPRPRAVRNNAPRFALSIPRSGAELFGNFRIACCASDFYRESSGPGQIMWSLVPR